MARMRITLSAPSVISCTSTTRAAGEAAATRRAPSFAVSVMNAPVARCWGTVARTQGSLTVMPPCETAKQWAKTENGRPRASTDRTISFFMDRPHAWGRRTRACGAAVVSSDVRNRTVRDGPSGPFASGREGWRAGVRGGPRRRRTRPRGGAVDAHGHAVDGHGMRHLRGREQIVEGRDETERT